MWLNHAKIGIMESSTNQQYQDFGGSHHMKSISDFTRFEQETLLSTQRFFKKFFIGHALKSANAYKSKGFSALSILLYAVQLVFMQMSMYRDALNTGVSTIGKSKDAVYRLMRSSFINWTMFLFLVAAKVCKWVKMLTSDTRLTAFVLDDTLFQRPYSKKLELVARVFDHNDKKYKRGFRSLFLGWTDGATFIPLSFRHMSSPNEKNRYCEAKAGMDGRTNGARIKKEAIMKSTDIALRMLKDSIKYGIPARHVLFDSWFTNPAFIMDIHNLGLHCIGRLKNSRTRYWLGDQAFTIKQLYDGTKKRRGKSKYLLSTAVTIKSGEQECDARIVYVRDRAKKKNWIAFICTDMNLTEEQIIELYGKRWSIEVFFKTCKSYLKFTGEFQQLSYEAITAHTSIVSIRYMIFAVEQRQNIDLRRTPGDLFYLYTEEAKDILFLEVISILIDDLTELICGVTRLNKNEVMKLMDKFFETLPLHIKTLVRKKAS